MIDLKSLSITIGNTDISKLVTNVNIMESIKGGIKGTLSFQDNINFYDTFLICYPIQAYLLISNIF